MLNRAGLDQRDDLTILLWRDAGDGKWPELVATATAECRRAGASLLVVDTLPAFARLQGDGENDAAAALEAIGPLQAAAAEGLAVLVVRHERESGGEVGDSGRGSSAFTGAVDVVVRIGRRPEDVKAGRPNVRECTTHRTDRTVATPVGVIRALDGPSDGKYLCLTVTSEGTA